MNNGIVPLLAAVACMTVVPDGSFPGMRKIREFKVVCGDFSKSVRYDGREAAQSLR